MAIHRDTVPADEGICVVLRVLNLGHAVDHLDSLLTFQPFGLAIYEHLQSVSMKAFELIIRPFVLVYRREACLMRVQ